MGSTAQVIGRSRLLHCSALSPSFLLFTGLTISVLNSKSCRHISNDYSDNLCLDVALGSYCKLRHSDDIMGMINHWQAISDEANYRPDSVRIACVRLFMGASCYYITERTPPLTEGDSVSYGRTRSRRTSVQTVTWLVTLQSLARPP